MQPSGSHYESDDDLTFVHRDGEGKIDFRVKFLDGDWNAKVSFPNGESGNVCIFPEVFASDIAQGCDFRQGGTMAIEPGDLVHLKSGGPTMTVESVDTDFGIIACVWYEGKQMMRRNLGSDLLKKGPSPHETNAGLAGPLGKPEMIEGKGIPGKYPLRDTGFA